ncbi:MULTISPECIES: Mor transcription activator family protein [Lonsdalea]|uniref:DNA-binding protein n=2 Tax=Lonsdalea TaxID=1082702 RepID=A0ACD1J9W4_9GAMM|nr:MULTISPECIES: Mor transcription activator family protein [Lonsdalea]OSM95595.1 DNA-binding protein [Lonsdalea populi]OSM96676.1 DNA-binding protein [Lonsdalea populi]QPQ23394.1 DNA-binding protein [Lonsdalea populi]RAT11408.1 DNA-binding protein [Lonsdalea quercina]RAT12843.1 DNA-binding protein [Lonsdalea quercina]
MTNSNSFRSKGPELLVELAQHTANILHEAVDIDTRTADQIGEAVASHMMQVWGGQNVYFPMGMAWRVSQRDQEIFSNFNGKNHHELARKYGVSLQWIYSVVKRVRKEEQARIQGSPFKGDGADDSVPDDD